MTAAKPARLDLPRFAARVGARQRRVLSVTTAPRGREGEGFPVRRAFAGVDRRHLDPFVYMDEMGEVEYAPGEPKGTAWHPHRGFETFTYLMAGRFLHRDSNGGGGTIKEGGSQYMTAGDGILHIETPPEKLVMSGGLFHGIQLWINLPRAKKRIAPAYQNLDDRDSTLVSTADGGALVRVLAGSVDRFRGPGISHTPIAIAHVTIAPGATAEIPWRPDFNALLYVLAGAGKVGASRRPISSGQTAVLAEGDCIAITANARQDSRSASMEVFLIGGVPLREPVVQEGPFVMNTRAEIKQAFADFQSGRMGRGRANSGRPQRSAGSADSRGRRRSGSR